MARISEKGVIDMAHAEMLDQGGTKPSYAAAYPFGYILVHKG